MNRHGRDIVVLGGSAGAIPAVNTILRALPADLAATFFVTLHRGLSVLPSDHLTAVLSAKSSFTAMSAKDEQPIEHGHVYVAPADEHLVLETGIMRLEHSPKEHRFRPCIDVLFKSAAATYGRRVIGVLLSGGFGTDGAAGLWQISSRGGVTIIQDPADALYGGMPQAAMDIVAADYILRAAEIGPMLIELVSSGAAAGAGRPRILIVEDESVVATSLQATLIDMGYDAIEWVPTGEEAIQVAARERPDLILMDIRLAGALDGVETARRIWQMLQIPTIYCTAHSDHDTVMQINTTESYGYVVKPFRVDAVRATIELALGRREKELR
jgi:chemotaxis response regulator CheB